MFRINETWRFWLPVIGLGLFGCYCSQKLIRAHFEADVAVPNYEFDRELPACRGAIYDATGKACPLVRSVPLWEYHLDPVSLTNTVVRPKGERIPRTRQAICRQISTALGLDYHRVLSMSEKSGRRYQYLGQSSDPEAHRILADRRLVSGVVIEDRQVRQYFHARRLSHVIGAVNKEGVGSAGLELRYNRELTGIPGRIHGCRDARGAELYDKRIETVAPIPGADLHLTIDHNLQYEVETALAAGVEEFGAGSGWCIVLDVKTGAVLALASLPDFNPLVFGRTSDAAKVNRATNIVYEPGSVMKVITACAGIDSGIVTADTLYNTNRNDDRYYRLPGDGTHVWEPTMTVRDAIVHSSNIVIGKLGVDIGPERLYGYMKEFGFGRKTGVESPGEEPGLLPPWQRWDKVKWSRAPIGQGVAVTAIQIASAYQAIANDGVRMKPHLLERIARPDGTLLESFEPEAVARPISAETSRTIREMMLGVASKSGTARRAAIKGYSVAGKTGTAQKVVDGRYSDSLYRATFCGIVPSGVVKRNENDAEPVPARVVILVTLDFEHKAKFHQGGNSSAPIFKRVATAAMRYYEVEPDRPDELLFEGDDDGLDEIMEERGKTAAEAEEAG